MVAVVDVDRRAENLGLDPLPDIDFNIRCGNTLVGYATEAQLNVDLKFAKTTDEYEANEIFKKKIDSELINVANADRLFKQIQIEEDDNIVAFKKAKLDLKIRLTELNDSLNHRLHLASGSPLPYDEWLSSHQPFNWLAEFYQIMNGNGGFDVIIGNPPYVEYTRRNVPYALNNYETIKSSNLYAFVFERSFHIGKDYIGLIIQLSALGTETMRPLQKFLLKESSTLHYGCYPERPQQLFEGACIALAIFICNKKGEKNLYGAGTNRVSEGARSFLFKALNYLNIEERVFLSNYKLFPKFKQITEPNIFVKLGKDTAISKYIGNEINNSLSYRTAGGRYWKIVINRPFSNISTSNKTKSLNNLISSFELVAVLNTNLFWWYYVNYFDLYNFKDYMIFNFPYSSTEYSDILKKLGQDLMNSYENNKIENTQFIQSRQQLTIFESFNPAKSKFIIDEIDKVLAKHYGFTDEELDFIINYDIKYRMGDELNSED